MPLASSSNETDEEFSENVRVPGSSKFIQPENLPAELQPNIPGDVTDRSMNAKDIEFKVRLIERALVETGGSVARASRILELSANFVHRLKRQGIVKRI